MPTECRLPVNEKTCRAGISLKQRFFYVVTCSGCGAAQKRYPSFTVTPAYISARQESFVCNDCRVIEGIRPEFEVSYDDADNICEVCGSEKHLAVQCPEVDYD